jgi:HAD superfamily hydrolase (TIGR01509 family)
MPSFAAAIFDMDGLLIDSERAIMRAWLDLAQARGHALDAEGYLACVGRASADSDAILAALIGSDEAVQSLRRDVAGHLRDVFPLRPGAATLLAALAARGVPCAVASSSTREEIGHRLREVDVHHHFPAAAGGDEVARGKPDPAVYRLAAERLGVAPSDCLAFEDSVPGATAALAAGMQVVVVPDLKPATDEIAARSLAVLGSLEEAVEHLDAWFGA